MFALVDCNNFFVSCERVFHPSLRFKPVVVLSNNDGCAISRSNEAKVLGIAMGAPIFQCAGVVQQHNVTVFSANFVLYGDMSHRVMSVLSEFTPRLEVYSIDEAFLSLEGLEPSALDAVARQIRAGVKQQTGIPVCVGLAPTKTLAKIANHIAKNHKEMEGVFLFQDEETMNAWLQKTPVDDVWGIGKAKAGLLERHGIHNALDLKNAPDQWIQKHLTVMTLRTVLELRGIACLALEEIQPDKKAICTSRTFGVEAYVSRSAEKLRDQNSLAGYIQVFIETNRFKETPYYRNAAGVDLSPPDAYTPRLIATADHLLKKIFRDGFSYKRCGVILSDFVPQTREPRDLFEAQYQGSDRQRLMEVMDQYNRRAHTGKLFFAAEGLGKSWSMKQAHRSKRFTTCWDELLEILV